MYSTAPAPAPARGPSQNPAQMASGHNMYAAPVPGSYPFPNRYETWNDMPPLDYFATVPSNQKNMVVDPKPPSAPKEAPKAETAPKVKEAPKLENTTKYEGLTLRKDESPPFGEIPSWSRVIKTPMSISLSEISKILPKKAKTNDISIFLNRLRSGRQRVQVERLLADKNRAPDSKNTEWTIVSLDEERGSHGKRSHATETKALHIILKGQPRAVVQPAKDIIDQKKGETGPSSAPVPTTKETTPKKPSKNPLPDANRINSFGPNQYMPMPFPYGAERESTTQIPASNMKTIPTLPPIIVATDGKSFTDGFHRPSQSGPTTSPPTWDIPREQQRSSQFQPRSNSSYAIPQGPPMTDHRNSNTNPVLDRQFRNAPPPGRQAQRSSAPDASYNPFVEVIDDSAEKERERLKRKQAQEKAAHLAYTYPAPRPKVAPAPTALSMSDESYTGSSEDDSDDDSFQFSAASVDLSTPVSSPRSATRTIPILEKKSKRQSIDLMTELRNQKSTNQEPPRGSKIAPRRASKVADDVPLAKKDSKSASKKAKDNSHSSRLSVSSDKSSAYDEALSSLRNSVQAVEMLEQEYIRKLEKLRLDEARQLDQKIEDIKQYGLDKKRELEKDTSLERDREQEKRKLEEEKKEQEKRKMQEEAKEREKRKLEEEEKERVKRKVEEEGWERERQRMIMRELERERERERERQRERDRDRDRDRRPCRRMTRSRSRSSERSPRRPRRRYYDDDYY